MADKPRTWGDALKNVAGATFVFTVLFVLTELTNTDVNTVMLVIILLCVMKRKDQ